jgi:predicted phosphoribosyltransferase
LPDSADFLILESEETMVIHRTTIFQNREHAACLLAERLMEHERSDAVVVAVSGGGIHVGFKLAQKLQLPLEAIPCLKLKHPADDSKTIGAVCAGAIIIHEDDNNIPQDFIYHQIQLLQHTIRGKSRRYQSDNLEHLLKGKVVILADDVLMTGDTMLACLRTIRKYNPWEIIVAIPIVTPTGAKAIRDELDKLIYLAIEPQLYVNYYAEFPDVSDDEVITLLQQARTPA